MFELQNALNVGAQAQSQIDASWFAAYATWFAGFAAILAGFATWLAGHMQVRELKKQIKLAQEGMRQTEKRDQQELRPYVFLASAKFTQVKTGPSGSKLKTNGKITYVIDNRGKTPARQLSVAVRAFSIPSGGTPNLSRYGTPYDMGPLGPEQEISDDVAIEDINTSEAENMRNFVDKSNQQIHIVGKIEYKDQLDELRWTTFHCYIGGDVAWEEELHTAQTGNDFF